MVRGRLACDVITPNEALVACRFGALNVGWFSTLKNSKRSCRYLLSENAKFFSMEGSHSFSPSWRTFGNAVEKVRMWYANALEELVANSDVSNVGRAVPLVVVFVYRLSKLAGSAPGPPEKT